MKCFFSPHAFCMSLQMLRVDFAHQPEVFTNETIQHELHCIQVQSCLFDYDTNQFDSTLGFPGEGPIDQGPIAPL